MKLFVFSTAVFFGLGAAFTNSVWARGPAGGMGYSALAGTTNLPRAGLVPAPYGLYGVRPSSPVPTYSPSIRSFPGSSSFPSSTIPQGTFRYRSIPQTNPPNPFNGPSYYYFRR